MNKTFFTTSFLLLSILFLTTACVEPKPRISQESLVNKNVDSLNIKTIREAETSYKKAKDMEADYFAPVTFALATKELKKAVETIETDYSKTQKINALAKSAGEHYKQAIRITLLSKEFEKKDFANEDYILWYWQQLKNINAPTKTKLDLTQQNSVVVDNIRNNIITLSKALQDSQADYAKLTQEYAKLKQQNIKPVVVKKKSVKKLSLYELAKEKLDSAQAEVTQEGSGVLLFVTGFKFADKNAELGSQNNELIAKIAKIINHEKDLKVDINVHTDSIGSVMQNQKLSERRAENILKALAKVGSLDTSKITTRAYGESQPVVSNMLKAGRAKNRRIEIYIYK